MPNNAKNFLAKESIKDILDKLDALSGEMSKVIKDRQRLEGLKRRRMTEIDLLKATIFIKVYDELAEGKPHYPDPQRRDSEVICRLAYDPAYRRAVNSIRSAEIRLARLQAQEQLLLTQTERLRTEERLLLMEITAQ